MGVLYRQNTCVFTACMPGSRRRCQVPWDRSYRQLWATMWVLGLEPGSLEEQPVLLTIEPSCKPTEIRFFISESFSEVVFNLLGTTPRRLLRGLDSHSMQLLYQTWAVSTGQLRTSGPASQKSGRSKAGRCKGFFSGELPKAQQDGDCSVAVHACQLTGKNQTSVWGRAMWLCVEAIYKRHTGLAGSQDHRDPKERPTRLLSV